MSKTFCGVKFCRVKIFRGSTFLGSTILRSQQFGEVKVFGGQNLEGNILHLKKFKNNYQECSLKKSIIILIHIQIEICNELSVLEDTSNSQMECFGLIPLP